MSWLKVIPILLAIGGIWWILYHEIDFAQVYQALVIFPKPELVGVFLLSLAILVLKAARFWTLLHRFGIKTNFWLTLKVSIAGSAASPLPGGESFRGVLLRHEINKKISHTSGAIISQAYFEVAIAVLLMSLGVLINDDLFMYILGCIGIMALFAFALTNPKATNWIKHIIPEKPPVTRFFNFLENLQDDFRETFINKTKMKPNKVFYEISALTLVSHILGGVLLWLVFTGIGVEAGFIMSVFLYVASIVLSSVGMFSPGGIGVTEGGLIGLMALFQLDPGKALAALVLFRFSTLIFSITLGIIFLIIFYGKTFIKRKVLTI